MGQILKIIPYFGKLPPFWNFYVDSLARNPILDLLFVTDIAMPANLPQNIKVVKSSLDGFFDLAEKKLGISIAKEYRNAYKICDYKPLVGKIYEEYTQGYKYWACGDIDIIYGNLHRYLRYPLAHDYDVVSFKEEWLSGAFTVVKNMPLLNTLAAEAPDFDKVVNTAKCLHYDECGTKYGELRLGYTPKEAQEKQPNDIVCWTLQMYLLETQNIIKTYYRDKIKESLPFDERLMYENGRVLADGGYSELAIYHFVSEKRYKHNVIPQWISIPNKYYIAATGIYNENEYRFYSLISLYRKQYGKLLGLWQRVKDSYNYRIARKK